MSMILDRSFILLPLLPYLLLAAGLCGVLAMYLTLKREIAAQLKRNRRVEAMLLRLREAAAGPTAPGVEPSFSEMPGFLTPAPRPGMNLSRRVQALRLLRRGEDLGHIAAALGVPRKEVELVVRVHKLTGGQLTLAAFAPAGAAQGLRSEPPYTPVSGPLLETGYKPMYKEGPSPNQAGV
jgi:hypothetical protein